MSNIITMSDSYKYSHYLQYPPKTEFISSYIESRGGAYDQVLFFGLQAFLKKYLAKPFTRKDIDEAEEMIRASGLPFNRAGFDYILNRYKGLMPVHIQAVKEGTVLPTSNVLVQVVNTDSNVPWLTSFLETMLLRAVWYPTTVATRSHFIKQIILANLNATSDDPAGQIGFKLHDFGDRGASSHESAGIGGMAHLINFMGSDTVSASVNARKFYGETIAGFSIPAAEHSTITCWGANKEVEAYRNMLTQFARPGSMVAVVSDSYDIYNAASNIWGDTLKDEVIASGATVIVRPDSGDPTVVPVEVIELLMEKYGFETNSKGFKVLPSCIRVIQGDGVNENSIAAILDSMKEKGLSGDNIAFGMGGELLQTPNRDTLRFAMKASAIKGANGMWDNVSKNPITDPTKKSKVGRLALIKKDGEYKTVSHIEANGSNLLEDVFVNGQLVRNQNFAEIRALSNS